MKHRILWIAVLAMLMTHGAFATYNWTWYIVSTQLGTDGVGQYLDVTIGLKADAEIDVWRLGNFSIEGTMASQFYDFEESGGTYKPVLALNHLIDPPPAPTNYDYIDIEVTNPTDSYNWELIIDEYAAGEGNGYQILTAGVSVATIRFYVKVPSGKSAITFDTEIDFTFQDDNLTKVSVSYDNTGGDVSLPVVMSSIQATAIQESGIVLTWRTESESGCAGFHVWKGLSESGEYARITQSLIQAQGNTSTGHDYRFEDRNVRLGTVYWYKIEEIGDDGTSLFHGPVSAAGISVVPETFGLSAAYPNPFNPETRFEYRLAEDSEVMLSVYTLLGQRIKDIVAGRQKAGYYLESWDGTNTLGERLTSGVYLLHLTAGGFTQTRKVTLIR